MTKPRLVTLLLFVLAMIFYAVSWTSIATGFAICSGIIGIFFEAGMWVSLFGDAKKETTLETKNSNDGAE